MQVDSRTQLRASFGTSRIPGPTPEELMAAVARTASVAATIVGERNCFRIQLAEPFMARSERLSYFFPLRDTGTMRLDHFRLICLNCLPSYSKSSY